MSIPKVKYLLTLLILFFSQLSNPSVAKAAAEFSTSFHSEYQVEPKGSSSVIHEIAITNLLAQLYTTEYTILIGSPEISGIAATQDGQVVEFVATKSDTSTSITLKNLTPVIGQGQTTTLKLSYRTAGVAERLGRTWSINIPRLTKANEASEFTRVIRVPAELGNPSAEYPSSSSVSKDPQTGETVLLYKGHPNKSITLLFGNSEYYHLNLEYQIKNDSLSPSDTEIALPPDTPYQKILLDSITPAPREIKADSDGNWLAIYQLQANTKLSINASLYLEVFALPQGKTRLQNKKALTKELPFWQVQDSSITELADKLNTPLNIYNYLTTNLTYDYQRLSSSPNRLGAQEALDNPTSALCTEYTDLFITLSRALNIPAREINGFAYTNNSRLQSLGLATADVLHAWPEYYNSEESAWIQVDPTWGHLTGGIDYFHKLDFNHIAFVIHGEESEYPLPAGQYKTDPTLSTVSVEVVDKLPEVVEKVVESSTDNSSSLTNLGNTSVNDEVFGYLPPYGKGTISSSPLVVKAIIPALYPWALLLVITIIVSLVSYFRRKKK